MRRRSSASDLARKLDIPRARAAEAVIKAKLIGAVQHEVARRKLTHAELAARSGLPRTAVTGILSGSLQKVSLGRVLRLVDAAGLEADVRVKRAPAAR